MGEQDLFDGVVDAHRVLRGFLASIRVVEERTLLREHLQRLVDILPHHFDYEERPDGFFVHIERTHVHGQAYVAQLRDEHARFRGVVSDLMTDLDNAAIADEELVRRARILADELGEHERLEARLGSEPELVGPPGGEV